MTGEIVVDGSFFGTNAAFGQGGGLYVERGDGTIEVTRSAFADNSTGSSNGGAICSYGPTLDISDSSFVGNRGAYGSAFRTEAVFTIARSEFAFNEASGLSTIMADTNYSTVTDSSFVRNTSAQAPAVFLYNSNHSGTVVGSRLVENESEESGFEATALKQVNSANVLVENSLLYSSLAGGGSLMDETGGIGVINTSCASEDISGQGSGNALLSASPFTGEVYGADFPQNDDTPCKDLGNDGVADTHSPDWEMRHVTSAGADVSPVDAGVHFDAMEGRITAFSVADSMASFATENTSSCFLYAAGALDIVQVPTSDLAGERSLTERVLAKKSSSPASMPAGAKK